MKKSYRILFVFVAFLIWFIAARPSFINGIKPGIIDLFKFPLKVLAKSTSSLYDLATFQNRYEKKILLLEKKVAFLTDTAVGIREILAENKRLRSLLAFRSKVPSRSVAAEVIGRGILSIDSFIIIDKGMADGITTNMSVSKEEGLLGRVLDVGKHTSRVLLIDSPNSRIGAVIQRTREQGILVGLGGGICKVVYLAHTTDTKVGDTVIASELSSVSPRDILIGEVIRVLKEPHSLYASAIVRPSSNLFKIEEVLCIE